MQKYSRQRETILTILRGTDRHPTAAWIFEQAREQLPNISLGTVYRNLMSLRKSGEILSLSVGDGTERFDGNAAPHLHFFCTACKQVSDLRLPPHLDLASFAEREMGCRVDGQQILLSGVCRQCAKHKGDGIEKMEVML